MYLFHGLKDEVVNYGILEKILHFYQYFTTDGEVLTGTRKKEPHVVFVI